MRQKSVEAIVWTGQALQLLDQRLLPLETSYISCSSLEDVIKAIKEMVVRGAPAIGISAAYAVVLHLKELSVREHEDGFSRGDLLGDLNRLAAARPTAVNLMWAVDKMRECVERHERLSTLVVEAEKLAVTIHEEDIAANHKMSELALPYLRNEVIRPFSVLTHCNTGALATGGWGTALGVIRKAYFSGLVSEVFADETRPWLQGSRLTAWELQQDGIPVTLNADGAAGWLMQNKGVRWVIVGADRITANGDVANKVGTYSLAVLARYHSCKFMVVAPSTTVDMQCNNGSAIEIEMRTGDELIEVRGQAIAPKASTTINPVFDVTPAALIDVIVTERGVIEQPNLARMRALFS